VKLRSLVLIFVGIVLLYISFNGIAMSSITLSLHPNGIEPTDDTYVRERSPTTTLGTSDQLAAACGFTMYPSTPKYRFFIKWDLSTLTSAANAKILLSIKPLPEGWFLPDRIDIHFVEDDSWQESTTTWNNQPVMGKKLGELMIAGAGKTYEDIVEFDVSGIVQQELAGDKKLSIMGKLPNEQVGSGNPGVDFWSGESYGKAPCLVVTGGADTGSAYITASMDGSYVAILVTLTGPSGTFTHATSITGGYTFTNLTPGAYTATATYQGKTAQTTVQVIAGQTASADLNFGGETPTPTPDFMQWLIDLFDNPTIRRYCLYGGTLFLGVGALVFVIDLFAGRKSSNGSSRRVLVI
jgi:hypothetical protein